MAEGELFHTGTVISANPKTLTCNVLRTEGGMLYNVPVANTTGGLLNNDVQWNQNLRGAIVYYTFFDDIPYILGTLPQNIVPAVPVSVNSTETNTGGSNGTTYGATDTPQMSSGRNIDYQPNDKVISTDGGASLSLLGEGGVVLKASPLAQIIMGAGMDFMRLVARELSIFTDFGSLEFSHGSSGRNGLTIKGGAMYGDESQPDPGIHTVFMHLGDTDQNPDSRFGVRVTDIDGNMFCGLVMQKNGKMVFTNSHDYLLSVGRNYDSKVDGNFTQEVCGSQRWEIHQDESRRVYGTRNSVIVQDDNKTVGKSTLLSVGEQAQTFVGQDKRLQIGGALVISANSIRATSTNGDAGADVKFACSSFDIVRE